MQTFFSQKEKIWILEDDFNTASLMKEILSIRYQTHVLSSWRDFEANYTAAIPPGPGQPDLVIVDLYLQDGFFLNNYSADKRKQLPPFSFLVLSYTDDIDVLRACFDRGAIDYIVKPFRKGHLIVKIEQALKQMKTCLPGMGPLPTSHSGVSWNQNIEGLSLPQELWTNLTDKERQILKLFLASQTHKLSREDILQSLWKNVFVHPSTINVHIHNLRKKLQSAGLVISNDGTGAWTLSGPASL